MPRLSVLLHTVTLLMSLTGVYIWLELAPLSRFSLQLFAFTILLYFVIKRLSHSQIWDIAPAAMSVEVALAMFALLLLIGSTGNADSLFYPLIYINVFFLVFASHTSTTIFTILSLVLFFYARDPQLTSTDLANLATLPLISMFFLFAKSQYQHATQKTVQLAAETQLFTQEQTDLIQFIETGIKPRLNRLKLLVAQITTEQQPLAEIEAMKQEIALMEDHVQTYQQQSQDLVEDISSPVLDTDTIPATKEQDESSNP